MNSHVRKLVSTSLALAAMPLFAQADGHGMSRGILRLDQRTVPVEATFDEPKASMHFGAPFSCRVPLLAAGSAEGERRYRVGLSANGGAFCDALRDRELTLTGDGPDRFMRLDSRAGVWSGPIRLEGR